MKKILYTCLAALLLMGALPVRGQGSSDPKLVDGYYQIGNAEQLKWFRDQVLAGEAKINGKLTADIKLSDLELNEDGSIKGNAPSEQWKPIGIYLDGGNSPKFEGIFDGQGHIVSGVYIDTDEVGSMGFFGGTACKAEIRNLGVVNSYISAVQYVGGVCGRADGEDHLEENGTLISNCYFSGTVIGKGDGAYVGGICGENDDAAKNIDCYNLGIVKGKNGCIGGICGRSEGSIINCYNVGQVIATDATGETFVGGICGYNWKQNYEHAVSVSNCFYLEGVATIGVGKNESVVRDLYPMSADLFNSGKVADLLGDAYGQSLSGTKAAGLKSTPVLLAFYPEEEQAALKVYSVIYDLNYEGAAALDTIYGNTGRTIRPLANVPDREGYSFVGWFDQKEGGTELASPSSIGTADRTFYAHWEKTDDPTALDKVTDPSSGIRVLDGRICITTDEPVGMRIVSITGRTVRTGRLAAGTNEISSLPGGVYIVLLDNGIRSKVLIR